VLSGCSSCLLQNTRPPHSQIIPLTKTTKKTKGAERKQAGAPFQGDQIDRVFRVLGHPTAEEWPLLEHLPHWRDNTGARARARVQ
jgi:hypothetical protein